MTDEEKSMYNNGNTINSSVMLILNLLGNCKSQNLQLSYCKFFYLHPTSKFKTYNMTVDIHLSRSKISILNGSRSTDVNTKYQQQKSNNLNSLAFFK